MYDIFGRCLVKQQKSESKPKILSKPPAPAHSPRTGAGKEEEGGRVRWARPGFKLKTCFSSAEDWEVERQIYLASLTKTFCNLKCLEVEFWTKHSLDGTRRRTVLKSQSLGPPPSPG